MTARQQHAVQLAVRVPRALAGQLDDLSPQLHAAGAEAVRAAAESYVCRLACERDAQRYDAQPLSDRELAFTHDPEGWSVTPTW